MTTREEAFRGWPPLEGMSVDDLLTEKNRVDAELGRIKAQLEAARLKVTTVGEYSDPDWFNRARGAQRVYGNRSQRIQARLAQLRREEKARNIELSSATTDRFKFVFMRLVRERLGDAEYRQLCALARAKVEAEETI